MQGLQKTKQGEFRTKKVLIDGNKSLLKQKDYEVDLIVGLMIDLL